MVVSLSKSKFVLSFIAVLLGPILFAQKFQHTLQDLKKEFPSEMAVYLKDKEHLFVTTKKDTFKVWSEFDWQIQLLSDQGLVYSEHSLPYSKFTGISNIKAQSFVPGKKPGKYKKIVVDNFKTEDVMSSGVFYDDSKQIAFSFPGGQEGSVFDLNYKEVYKDPHFIGKFYFISHLPSKEVEYSVTFPNNVTIHYELFNTEKVNLEFVKSTKGKNTTYTWRTKNVKPYSSVKGAPGFSHYAPHIVVRLGELKLKTKTVTVLPNVDALYNWYYSLVKDVNTEEDDHLKKITDSLITGISTNDEKARAIFNWVQDNIKYVAFEDGMGGFIPRQAAKVCTKRYGDCKDMASIITTMLKYCNIEAYLTWVGYRKIPYKYTDLPTPHVDNHMIASYKNNKGEFVFLDAVGSYTPYGYPTGFIQGKQTMVGIGKNKYELVHVPIVEKERNLKNDTVSMVIDNGKLTGKGRLLAKGYAKLDFVYPLINKNEEKRLERLSELVEKGNNKFQLQGAEFKGLKDRDKDLKITYDFTIEDYAKAYKDEIFINLHLDRAFKGSKLDIEKRNGIDLSFEYKKLRNDRIEIEIPTGYKVSYVPENASFKSGNFGFDFVYQQEANKVVLTKNIYVDSILLKEADFKDWNEMVKALNKAYKETIIIKK